MLLPVIGKTLPEIQRLHWVISSSRHIYQTNMVRFRFLRATMWQRPSVFCYPAISEIESTLVEFIGAGDRGPHILAKLLHRRRFAHPLRAVMGGRMTDFMADHRRQFGIVLDNLQQPGRCRTGDGDRP